MYTYLHSFTKRECTQPLKKLKDDSQRRFLSREADWLTVFATENESAASLTSEGTRRLIFAKVLSRQKTYTVDDAEHTATGLTLKKAPKQNVDLISSGLYFIKENRKV